MVRQRIRQIIGNFFVGIILASVEICRRFLPRMPGLLLKPGRKNRAAWGAGTGRGGLPGIRCFWRNRRLESAPRELPAAHGGGSSPPGGPDPKGEHSTHSVG